VPLPANVSVASAVNESPLNPDEYYNSRREIKALKNIDFGGNRTLKLVGTAAT
jgi:hypothetical protein